MKIAFIICGRVSLNLHNQSYIKDLQNFIKCNNIKTFCAINDVFEISDDFLQDFNVIKHVLYKFNAEDHASIRIINKLFNIGLLSAFYGLKLCIEMIDGYQKETGELFDCVWYTRDDIIMKYELPKQIIYNTIYVNNINDTLKQINGLYAYGDFDSMKIYCNVYNHFLRYERECKTKKHKGKFNHENFLYVHLKEFNVKYIITNTGYRIDPCRIKR